MTKHSGCCITQLAALRIDQTAKRIWDAVQLVFAVYWLHQWVLGEVLACPHKTQIELVYQLSGRQRARSHDVERSGVVEKHVQRLSASLIDVSHLSGRPDEAGSLQLLSATSITTLAFTGLTPASMRVSTLDAHQKSSADISSTVSNVSFVHMFLSRERTAYDEVRVV